MPLPSKVPGGNSIIRHKAIYSRRLKRQGLFGGNIESGVKRNKIFLHQSFTKRYYRETAPSATGQTPSRGTVKGRNKKSFYGGNKY
jgi:hypothetical protein